MLYDDRIDFYFNFKDNAKSLTLSELNTVSGLSSSSPPAKIGKFCQEFADFLLLIYCFFASAIIFRAVMR